RQAAAFETSFAIDRATFRSVSDGVIPSERAVSDRQITLIEDGATERRAAARECQIRDRNAVAILHMEDATAVVSADRQRHVRTRDRQAFIDDNLSSGESDRAGNAAESN